MKYKYIIPIIIILLIVNSIIQDKNWEKEKRIHDLISNDIKFSGVITDLKISRNHDFGVITIKIKETNRKEFNPILNAKYLFPYAIKDSVAEIYITVSSNLKKGDFVKVDSNNEEAIFSNASGIIYRGQILITSEETNIDFVKENSALTKQYLISILDNL
ncbi:hypothetical protein [Flavobacterium microcysteis]|uniref:DUF4131 domain-containing protein n=1 Tax=Flavobacterium microcysteis TaxID=2596891 RepID=A0A501PZG0_9FLAO|nr:hypothetical protein [Flavobacterium microcysteis]TPD65397.1 hypothetical protein FJA49_14460 [Flavobacterium microcysteis]